MSRKRNEKNKKISSLSFSLRQTAAAATEAAAVSDCSKNSSHHVALRPGRVDVDVQAFADLGLAEVAVELGEVVAERALACRFVDDVVVVVVCLKERLSVSERNKSTFFASPSLACPARSLAFAPKGKERKEKKNQKTQKTHTSA